MKTFAPVLLSLSLLLPALAAAAPAVKAPRPKPSSSITVKVVSPAQFTSRVPLTTPYVITTADQDSCTVWVTRHDLKVQAAAFAACWQAIAAANGCNAHNGQGCN